MTSILYKSRYKAKCFITSLVPLKNYIAILLSIVVFQITAIAQVAPVNPPTGGFAIDGGLRAGTPTTPSPFAAGQGDWFPAISPATGGSVFTNAGVPISPSTTQTSGKAVDNYNSNDNIFTTGSKFNDYIENLSWFTNSAPDKNDINNALYHVSRDGSNNQWIFISGDRLSTNGTSYIDFELLQGTVTRNGTTSGGFTGTTATGKTGGGGRTENDIIISMEYTNGGSKPNVYIYQWKKPTGSSTWSYQLVTGLTDLANNAFAETNRSGAETNLPYSAFGTTSYQQFAFVEAAVNITYLLNQTGLACGGLNIQTLWVKTKASASSTAALKDFMDPISVNFTFGSTTIDPAGPYCVSDNTAHTLTGSLQNGIFSGDGVSNNQFTPSVAGVGKHTITYRSADGSCSTTTVIEVVGLPTVYTLSGNAICASAPGTGVITLSNSQTGVSYQLKKASDNSNVQTAQSGTTGSSLTWSGLPANVNYYVQATGATPTSCTSITTNASISEVANPTVYTLSGNAICASAPGTGVITLSNSQTGVSYQLKKASDNSNVQTAQSGTTGSSLTWSGLPANVNYYVQATGATPTSCTSNTTNASISEVANPTVYTLSGNAICASAPGTGVITLSNSQTGVSYQLKKASDNSNVQTAQSGTTGSSLTWSGLPANVNYYVQATGATPTSCTSNTTNASISEVANPDAPATLYNPPACDQAYFTVTVSSVTSGATYTIKDKNGNTIVNVANPNGNGGSYQAPSSSNFNFSNIPAGSGFTVSVTNNGCSSTPSVCPQPINNITSKAPIQKSAVQEINRTTVTAAPNPFNDRIRFTITPGASGRGALELYNLLGQKVRTVFEGQVQKGQVQTIEYSVPNSQRTNLIYYFSVGTNRASGKLINLR